MVSMALGRLDMRTSFDIFAAAPFPLRTPCALRPLAWQFPTNHPGFCPRTRPNSRPTPHETKTSQIIAAGQPGQDRRTCKNAPGDAAGGSARVVVRAAAHGPHRSQEDRRAEDQTARRHAVKNVSAVPESCRARWAHGLLRRRGGEPRRHDPASAAPLHTDPGTARGPGVHACSLAVGPRGARSQGHRSAPHACRVAFTRLPCRRRTG
jgi:hypothetical protein